MYFLNSASIQLYIDARFLFHVKHVFRLVAMLHKVRVFSSGGILHDFLRLVPGGFPNKNSQQTTEHRFYIYRFHERTRPYKGQKTRPYYTYRFTEPRPILFFDRDDLSPFPVSAPLSRTARAMVRLVIRFSTCVRDDWKKWKKIIQLPRRWPRTIPMKTQ